MLRTMAYVLPLPLDLQLKIDGMVKTEKQKNNVMNELGKVIRNFWENQYTNADYVWNTHWMEEDHPYSEEYLDACCKLIEGKLDRDDFICRFDRYRDVLCFYSFATRYPEGFSYVNHTVYPLP